MWYGASKVIPKIMDNTGRYQGPLLQARINFNPKMDKKSHPL